MDFLDRQLAKDIWDKKYQFNGETIDEWYVRVSGGNKEIEKLMREGKFLFGGRILSNRGLDKLGKKVTYSNCYVLSTGDSIEEIYQTHSDLARTFSTGGGVGIDISTLRPKGTKVNNAAETTSGAVSFMPSFSQVAEVIAQNGRRGALMISMSCEHPDIEEFIDAKANDNMITKANISVRMTDAFMEAVVAGEMFECRFEMENGDAITKEVDARKLFMKLAENNWNWAEPGILYWDRIEKYNLLQYDDEFKFAGVNPCAEEPLPDGGSCLLGSINLSEYVENGRFNAKKFRNDVETVVVAMNEVLDEGLPLHPLEIQKQTVKDYRQIGVGVMGIADMLIKLDLRYGSEESIELCDMIGHDLANSALKASAKLARDYGAYPKYKEEVLNSKFFAIHADEEVMSLAHRYGLRNSQLLTIAPTGTISTMLGISGGIEPIFANYYTRKTESLHAEGDVFYKVYTPIVESYMKANDLKDEAELPECFVTSQTITPTERLEMQGVWQSHIDASISSTINLSNDYTIEDVFNIYVEAWKYGLKGITIYRDGCKRGGVLITEPKKEDKEVTETNISEELNIEGLNRGQVEEIDIADCIAKGRRLVTGCGTLWATAYFDKKDGCLKHIFLDKGSKGGCNSFMSGLSRMISLSARAGISTENVADQLLSTVQCNSYFGRTLTKHDTSKGGSCPSAIGLALREMVKEIQAEINREEVVSIVREEVAQTSVIVDVPKVELTNKCPVCEEPLRMTQGCMSCVCGYSRCDL